MSLSTRTPTAPDALLERVRREGPMNLERAFEVMEQFDLEGLVLGEPVNVFHLLGYWPQIANTRAGQPPTSFALLARDARQMPGLVTSRFIYYYTYTDGRFARELQVHLYREPGDSQREDDATKIPAHPVEFPDLKLAPLSAVEQRRRAALDAAIAAHGSAVDSGAALVRAMRDMGLWKGRVAFDHPVIAAVCERHSRPGELVAADNVLRSIRIIKSRLEIELMRRASEANVGAVLALGRSIRETGSYAELRHRFEVETALRGNRALFLTVDRVSSELSDDPIAEGQTFFIDGVSHYLHYHGDYARTVFVGEPVGAARTAARAIAHAWDAVREQLRPGLRYSQITALGREALRKGGFHDLAIGFGPHSVGLMHTDEPCEDSGGFYRKLDLELREHMILSVDCPVLNTGIGGSAHIEDLMLITADGATPLHELAAPVITV